MKNLDDLAAYALHQVERLRALQARLADLSCEGRSPDGLVVARTGAGGRVLDLRLDPRALGGGAERLGRSVRSAITAAQNAYAQEAGKLMATELPPPGDEEYERGVARIDELTERLNEMTRRLER
ncbi:YbaB/EbfC family nucleoid-associated protein [Hamadaea tsunoensis]|uniref:YbaB/EbfC family nucleoid-associated protein n=1 Tax=Hamadaea tsunoensis TaxID=53368 RepID=UPI001B7FC804|nr:YbaB/EbfC family nucleoid-associated protein [Hamadaea tsunoensis]